MSGDVSGAQLTGRRDLPYPFFKLEKKTAGLSLMCHRSNVYGDTLILRNLPCPVKILIAHLCIVFTPDK